VPENQRGAVLLNREERAWIAEGRRRKHEELEAVRRARVRTWVAEEGRRKQEERDVAREERRLAKGDEEVGAAASVDKKPGRGGHGRGSG
jgi:hypothetical protein